ncbi:hypothetical protein [Streptomyces showdoensis]|uniref:Uncharacterized protein n=1 Tax=Streptomyces showdoensis TaxID=68268 RepID=A0A2P2GVH4_STREW|nr:hypothetical protein [Streptomyces showdoensis]KKZ74889.1 hypothetical protein VO63_05435 [Streptomyces showdoensis]
MKTVSPGLPDIVRQTTVVSESKNLLVSTVRIGGGYYDTVIFDESPSKQHTGMLLAGFVIDHSSQKDGNREAAIERHEQAAKAAHSEEPKAVAA